MNNTSSVLVSVLMPNYNNAEYLKEAIESVLNQTYSNLELIIIDDCSTDNSWEIIKQYAEKDRRITIYRNNKNLGRPKTRNKLLSLISEESKYFVWMDADDIMLNKLIEDKVNYLEKHPEVSALGSSIKYVDENLNLIMLRKYPQNSEEIKKFFLLYPPVSQGGLMLCSSLKKEKYDLKYSVCQDYELWTRLLSKGYKFENLSNIYYLYRQQKNQGKQKRLKLTLINTLKIKKKYLFKRKYFNIKAFTRFIAEGCLMIVPEKIILWLFYKIKKN